MSLTERKRVADLFIKFVLRWLGTLPFSPGDALAELYSDTLENNQGSMIISAVEYANEHISEIYSESDQRIQASFFIQPHPESIAETFKGHDLEEIEDQIKQVFKEQSNKIIRSRLSGEKVNKLVDDYYNLFYKSLVIQSEKLFRNESYKKQDQILSLLHENNLDFKNLDDYIQQIHRSVQDILESINDSTKLCKKDESKFPVVVNNFINRESEFFRCFNQFKRTGKIKVIICPEKGYGLGGVGKTALARQLANDILGDKLKGVFEVDLGSNHLQFEQLCQKILKFTGNSHLVCSDLNKNKTHIKEILNKGEYGILVDNVKAEKNQEIMEWLCSISERINIIITTREKRYFDIVNLISVPIAGLSRENIEEFIISLSGIHSSTILLRNADKIVEELYDTENPLIPGYPLAYEYVCIRIAYHQEQIADVKKSLISSEGDIYSKLFTDLYEKLSIEERDILRIASYFNFFCSQSLLKFIAKQLKISRIDEGIDSLTRKNLLTKFGYQQTAIKLRMHDVTRKYTLSQLSRISENFIMEKSIDFAVDFLDINGGDDNWLGYECIDEIYENLVQIIGYINKIDWAKESLIKILRDLDHYMYSRGHWLQRKKWGQCAVKKCEGQVDNEKIAYLKINNIAEYFYLINDYERALKWIDEGLNDVQNENLSLVFAFGCYEKSRTLRKLGLASAKEWALRSVSIFHDMLRDNPGDEKVRRGLGYALNGLGNILFDKGSLREARVAYDEGLNIFIGLDELSMIGVIYRNLGRLHYTQKNFPASRENYERAMDFFNRTISVMEINQAKEGLGKVLIEENNSDDDWEKGIVLLKEARDGYVELSALDEVKIINDYLNSRELEI